MQNQNQNQLSQKEKLLLQDLKSEEELCVLKYKNYAQQAQDQQLTQLFNELSGIEQQHYDTICQILQGNMSTQSKGGQSEQSGQSGQSQMGTTGQTAGLKNIGQSNSAMQSSSGNKTDEHLLHDMLSTEKYVSSSYNTSIFECTQPSIRQELQNIQKEEQQHGEKIFNYMQSHGMYQVQS